MQKEAKGNGTQARIVRKRLEPHGGIAVSYTHLASLELQAVYQHPSEFIEQLPLLSAELVLLDVGPEISFQFLADLHSAAPGCRLVLLARTISPELAYHAQELGVCALLSTSCTPQRFVSCLLYTSLRMAVAR